MALIGMSCPYYAIYKAQGNVVTYSDGGEIGKGVSVNITVNTTDDNNLYGNNGIAEADRSFTGGTVELTTDDLTPEISKAILGLVEEDVGPIPGVNVEGLKNLVYDDRQAVPYLGFGVIEKHQINNVIMWNPIVLRKIMFSTPGTDAVTQGESIEWQTPTVSGTLLRDDTDTHKWQVRPNQMLSTEAQAKAYLRYMLQIEEPSNGGGGESGGGEEPEVQTARVTTKAQTKDVMV